MLLLPGMVVLLQSVTGYHVSTICYIRNEYHIWSLKLMLLGLTLLSYYVVKYLNVRKESITV